MMHTKRERELAAQVGPETYEGDALYVLSKHRAGLLAPFKAVLEKLRNLEHKHASTGFGDGLSTAYAIAADELEYAIAEAEKEGR